MDINQIISLVVIIVAVFLLVKFIVGPAVKLIGGIIIFLIILYISQQYFHLNLNQIFGPLSPYLHTGLWTAPINWLVSTVNWVINGFLILLKNVPSAKPGQ